MYIKKKIMLNRFKEWRCNLSQLVRRKNQSRKRKLEEDEKFHLNMPSSSSLEDIYKCNWATGLYKYGTDKLKLEICVVASDVAHLMVITVNRRKHEN